MVFQDWIIETFGERGVAEAARYLGDPYNTVVSWVKLGRYPSTKKQEMLMLKSKGKLNFNVWRTEFLQAERDREAQQ